MGVSWADSAIEQLKQGNEVKITPHGNSMLPKIKSGEEVLLEPIKAENLSIGDVVLVKVSGNIYLHLIKAIKGKNELFLIGNNHGGINGWAKSEAVYGRRKIIRA